MFGSATEAAIIFVIVMAILSAPAFVVQAISLFSNL